jgi:hypothetical protein
MENHIQLAKAAATTATLYIEYYADKTHGRRGKTKKKGAFQGRGGGGFVCYRFLAFF